MKRDNRFLTTVAQRNSVLLRGRKRFLENITRHADPTKSKRE